MSDSTDTNNFLTEIISLFFEQYQNNEIAYLPKHCFLTYRPVFVESAKQTLMLWDKRRCFLAESVCDF
jgi:hypothetical protein